MRPAWSGSSSTINFSSRLTLSVRGGSRPCDQWPRRCCELADHRRDRRGQAAGAGVVGEAQAVEVGLQPMFVKEQIYSRREDIHAKFGGQMQGGIATPPRSTLRAPVHRGRERGTIRTSCRCYRYFVFTAKIEASKIAASRYILLSFLSSVSNPSKYVA